MGRSRGRGFTRKTLGKDLQAGLVLGVESVPDGLASGLLAGVNPLAGLYAYLFGMVGAALFTSSAFLTVQATGAMALVVADADLESRPDPERALFTLTIMCGIVMVLAGVFRAGRLVSFVPTAVMTGFMTAVGVSIVLGQLGNFTGYEAQGANRIARTIDLLLNIPEWNPAAVVTGAIAVLIIVVLLPTRLASLGLVVAVVVGSLAAALLNTWVSQPVVILSDLVDVPAGLPAPVLPELGDVLYLVAPAVSLAFVGLVQGAGVAAAVAQEGEKRADASRDFIGQGVGNVASGLFQGMPVGGSMSASAILVAAGARTRLALFIAGAVMAVVIVAASTLVSAIAMPALAALLIVVGVQSVRPSRVHSVIRSGPLPSVVMGVTFLLTLVIPLQYAVLVGVGMGLILFVFQQSNRVRVRRVDLRSGGRIHESDPPAVVPGRRVLILQPYGSLFFASAPTFEGQLPRVDATSHGAVVIVRLRGTDNIGLALIEVLRRFAGQLAAVDGTLKIIASEDRVIRSLAQSGLADDIGGDNVYRGNEWVGEALRRAESDARALVDAGEGTPERP